MQLQPLICVHDVEGSSRWYPQLLGCQSENANWERWLLDPDGYTVALANPFDAAR